MLTKPAVVSQNLIVRFMVFKSREQPFGSNFFRSIAGLWFMHKKAETQVNESFLSFLAKKFSMQKPLSYIWKCVPLSTSRFPSAKNLTFSFLFRILIMVGQTIVFRCFANGAKRLNEKASDFWSKADARIPLLSFLEERLGNPLQVKWTN